MSKYTLIVVLGCIIGLISTVAFPLANGVDPNNLGKGMWIYVVTDANLNCTGSSSNTDGMLDFLVNHDIDWIAVKCGDGTTYWSQFSTSLVSKAHNRNLKIFGYNRCKYPNSAYYEANVLRTALSRGADGSIIDAESEYEGNYSSQVATLCSRVKSSYPNHFLALSSYAYIRWHQSLPWSTFKNYVHAFMPQCYWKEMGYSPEKVANDMTDDIITYWGANRTVIPDGQAFNWVPSTEITRFNTAINARHGDVASLGTGISWWSAQHATSYGFDAIKNAPLLGGGSTEVIVDNADSGFSASSNWSTGTSSTDKYGTSYRYRSTAAVSDSALFSASLPSSGTWQVYAWWPQGTNRSPTAPYIIYYSGGSTSISVNQQTNGGKWNYLGAWSMNSGTNNVRVSCWTTTGYVVMADAVKWVKQ
jgi:hypothetical protein